MSFLLLLCLTLFKEKRLDSGDEGRSVIVNWEVEDGPKTREYRVLERKRPRSFV